MKNIIAVLCWFIPFKNIRHRLKVKYVKSKRIKYHNNNRIIIHMPNGDTVINPYSIPGLEVSFEGANSTIELFYPIRFHKSNFMCKDDCSIVIKQSCFININSYFAFTMLLSYLLAVYSSRYYQENLTESTTLTNSSGERTPSALLMNLIEYKW